MDRFSLYTSSPNELDFNESNTYDFLQSKLLINLNLNEIDKLDIDNIYDYVYEKSFGYSLTHLFQFVSYKYLHKTLTVNSDIIKECEKQLKYHCILSSLYTLNSLSDYFHNDKLLDVAKKYQDKCYSCFDISDNSTKEIFSGYCSDSSNGDKLRRSFKYIYKKIFSHSEFNYLYNGIDFKLNSNEDNKFLINSFLSEFSYDVIVNGFKNGMHIDTIASSIKNSLFKSVQRRRNTRKFIHALKNIDSIFTPIANDSQILYSFKKESMFHINAFDLIFAEELNQSLSSIYELLIQFPTMIDLKPFFTLVNEIKRNSGSSEDIKFILHYLTDVTIPVLDYCFFHAIYAYKPKDLNTVSNSLETYLLKLPKFKSCFTKNFNTNDIKTIMIDELTYCIINSFYTVYPTPPFESSFTFSSIIGDEYKNNADYNLQGEIALEYYELLYT